MLVQGLNHKKKEAKDKQKNKMFDPIQVLKNMVFLYQIYVSKKVYFLLFICVFMF